MRIRFLALGIVAILTAVALSACGGDDETATPIIFPATPTAITFPATPTPFTITFPATPTPITFPATPTPFTFPTATPEPTAIPTPVPTLADHFDGERIIINVGFSPGGGYDTVSRIMAQHLGKYFPGEPRFIIRNVTGGGSLKALQATLRADPDGLTVGLLHPRFVKAELAGEDVKDFDLDTILVVGAPTLSFTTSMWCTDKGFPDTWDGVQAHGDEISIAAYVGETGGTGTLYAELLGHNVKRILGYTGGTADKMAAFDRGEVDSTTNCGEQTVPRLYPEWLKDQRLQPIFWWQKEPTREWLDQLGYEGDVPYLLDVVGGTDDQKAALRASIVVNAFSRTFVLPPGVPDDIYNAWVSAFEQTLADPAVVSALGIAGYGGDIGYGSPEEFEALRSTVRELSPDALELFKQLAGLET